MTKSVLIIYTGGTIGMVNDPATGALCPFDFEQIAKAVPEIREFGFSINSYTLPEIIDSSDLKPALWADLCQIILDKYDQYSGFVILHGTDTMAYSAAALSFMQQRGNPTGNRQSRYVSHHRSRNRHLTQRDRKSTRLNSSHPNPSRMPSSA